MKGYKLIRSLVLMTVVMITVGSVSAGSADSCADGQWYNTSESTCVSCGFCREGSSCNKATGKCPGFCEDWYYPHSECWGYITNFADYLTLSHITDGPEMKFASHDRIEICFYQADPLVAREDRQYYAYLVQYALVEDTDYMDDADLLRVQDEGTIHKTITGLQPQTEYKFRIVLLRVIGEKYREVIDYSSASQGATTCTQPELPELLSISVKPSLAAVEIHYNIGDSSCNHYEYTEIPYRLSNESSSEIFKSVSPTSTQTTIYNLQSGLTYVFHVRVQNDQHLDIKTPEVSVTLSAEAFKDQESAIQTNSQGNDDEDDDVILYVTIVIAIAAALVAIIALIIAILIHNRTKKLSESEDIDHKYLTPISGQPPRVHAPPLPTIPHTPTDTNNQSMKGKYEGLKEREASSLYDQLAAQDYDNPDQPADTYNYVV